MKPILGLLGRTALVVSLLAPGSALAGPWIAPGDPGLRHDIQVLSDAGVITSPILAWPLSWSSVAGDLTDAVSRDDLDASQQAALTRLTHRMRDETRVREVRRTATLTAAAEPTRVRNFTATPRGELEAKAELDWTGERFAVRLAVTAADGDDVDDQDWRLDGSYGAVVIGNWMISAGAQERWWGPGWDSSLILSTNARPPKAFALQRNYPAPFKWKWLSWIGPWSTSVVWGQLEDGRAVPNTRLFGWQVNFRPLPDLEVSLERTAQWCGSGRPCGFDTFVDLLLGRDNQGDEGVDRAEEPGNQLAGLSLRWASPVGDAPYAVYAQFTGEDEASDLPSKFLGLGGIEYWGTFRETWSYRLYG